VDRDVIERKLDQLHEGLSALRPASAREKYLSSLLVVDRIDRWGNYLHIDPEAEEVLGFKATYYATESDWVVFNHPEDIWRTDILWQRALTGFPVRAVEYRTDDSDGYWVWLEDSFRPVEADPHGRVTVVEGCWRDITPRKRREIEFLIRQFELALRLGKLPERSLRHALIQFPGPVSTARTGRRSGQRARNQPPPIRRRRT